MELKATAHNDDASTASSLAAIALALSQIAFTQSAILEKLAPPSKFSLFDLHSILTL